MKKNIILWMAASAVVMLAFPWLAVTFVKGDAGMAVCFLLFFAVNPLYSVLIGAFAGKDALGIAAMLISILIRKKTQK
ncbi:hypothetical protein [Eisenbergiella tayi]|uniref:hypothetical protein n=1 Tax=Eisenbergiella tayi TaxID=1432052 RepID=UPI00242F84C1|nr:hypothetical protein [Eisenbergiella tayi]